MNDNQENNFIKSITSIIHKHAMLLVAMSQGLQATMGVALGSRHKCDGVDCEKVATWKKEELYMCDRHISQMIIGNEVFDDSWQEIEDSDQIRELEEFISMQEQMGLRNTVH